MSFKINDVVLTYQPSRVEVSYESPQAKLTADGSYILVLPSSRRKLRVTWGVEGTQQAVTEELKAKRTAALVKVTYDDTDGNEASITQAFMPLVPSDHIPGGDSAVVPYQGPVVLEFWEI